MKKEVYEMNADPVLSFKENKQLVEVTFLPDVGEGSVRIKISGELEGTVNLPFHVICDATFTEEDFYTYVEPLMRNLKLISCQYEDEKGGSIMNWNSPKFKSHEKWLVWRNKHAPYNLVLVDLNGTETLTLLELISYPYEDENGVLIIMARNYGDPAILREVKLSQIKYFPPRGKRTRVLYVPIPHSDMYRYLGRPLKFKEPNNLIDEIWIKPSTNNNLWLLHGQQRFASFGIDVQVGFFNWAKRRFEEK